MYERIRLERDGEDTAVCSASTSLQLPLCMGTMEPGPLTLCIVRARVARRYMSSRGARALKIIKKNGSLLGRTTCTCTSARRYEVNENVCNGWLFGAACVPSV